MKVSIIVPVYNVEKYLDKCLESLVNQTLKDIEIIVVNDGTSDNSQDIIDKYKNNYKNIVSIIKENGGQGSARNLGIDVAQGEYIGFVDSDDYIENNMYEKLYSAALNKKADIVICNNCIVYENSNNIIIENNYNKVYNDKENAFFGKMAVWNKIYKRELIIDNNIRFKEKVWYEDFAFTFKLLCLSKKTSFIEDCLYMYLLRQGSTMNNNNASKNLEILDAFDDTISYLKTHKMYKEYYKYLEFDAINHIYLSTTVRIANSNVDNKIKKEIINKINIYMKNNFNSFNNNKYIKTLTKNKKIIKKLVDLKLYNLVRIIFKIKRR